MSTIRETSPSCAPGTVREDFHPMEAIPFFRRFPPGPLRNVLYTFLFNGIVGTAFWVVAMMDNDSNRNLVAWFVYLVFANIIGYTIHALFGIGHMSGLEGRVKGPWLTTAYYTLVTIAGVTLGSLIASYTMNMRTPHFMFSLQGLAITTAISLVISSILSIIFFGRARSARAEAALQGERLRAERIEREAALANLRALQAQIEPHFLFNTLANVTSLVDPDPAAAKRMLESFIRFLRSSLAATRTRETTLGQERELIAAYLDVLQVRMGARLRYRVEVPQDLASFALPPMLLQPVVENAIGHGLEPKIEGGEVHVRAYRDGEHVAVEVADTGVGFAAATRGGVGLTNLRERLAALYGGKARLDILDNEPGGTRVRVRIPA